MTTELYKNRSYLGCHSAAFKFICSNMSAILKQTYAYVLAISMLATLYSALLMAKFRFTAIGDIVIATLATLAFLVASVFLTAHVKSSLLGIVNGAPFKDNMRKMLKITTFGFVVCITTEIVVNLCSTGLLVLTSSFIKSGTIMLGLELLFYILLLILMALVLSPLLYSGAKYLIEEGHKFKSILGHNYHIGFKRIGYLFCQMLIFALVSIVVGLFTLIPFVFILLAMYVDKCGVAMGDPTGLPKYFPWLMGVVVFIVVSINMYVILYFDTTIYYAYGNIQTDVNIKIEAGNELSKTTKQTGNDTDE